MNITELPPELLSAVLRVYICTPAFVATYSRVCRLFRELARQAVISIGRFCARRARLVQEDHIDELVGKYGPAAVRWHTDPLARGLLLKGGPHGHWLFFAYHKKCKHPMVRWEAYFEEGTLIGGYRQYWYLSERVIEYSAIHLPYAPVRLTEEHIKSWTGTRLIRPPPGGRKATSVSVHLHRDSGVVIHYRSLEQTVDGPVWVLHRYLRVNGGARHLTTSCVIPDPRHQYPTSSNCGGSIAEDDATTLGPYPCTCTTARELYPRAMALLDGA